MKNGNETPLNTLSTISVRTKRAVALIKCYGDDGMNLLKLFNPTKQTEYTLDVRRAYRGHAPALSGVKEAYGGGTARSWLFVQISDLMEFSGCKGKLSVKQIEELANIILTEYGYLKLTEMMDFFRKFKAGNYGKFYGTVDPMVITCALREFKRERAIILSRLNTQEREERDRTDPECIEYKRKYQAYSRKRIFYSRNFYSQDFTFEEFSDLWWLFNLGYERPDHGYIDT